MDGSVSWSVQLMLLHPVKGTVTVWFRELWVSVLREEQEVPSTCRPGFLCLCNFCCGLQTNLLNRRGRAVAEPRSVCVVQTLLSFSLLCSRCCGHRTRQTHKLKWLCCRWIKWCLCLADPLLKWKRQREQQKIRNRRHYLKVKADPELYARRKQANKEAQKKFHARRKQPERWEADSSSCLERQHRKSNEEQNDSWKSSWWTLSLLLSLQLGNDDSHLQESWTSV